MPDVNDPQFDEQDQSEVFDEDNQEPDDAGSGLAEMRTFEELPDVLDTTSAVGDADDDAGLIAEDLDDDEIVDLESDAELADFEDDELAPRMPEALNADRNPGDEGQEVLLDTEVGLDEADRRLSRERPAEVELELAGDLDDALQDDAQAAAGAEAETLADDDIADLGYGDADPDATDGLPGAPVQFEIVARHSLWAVLRDGELVHEYGHAERAVHEAAELARSLRGSGQPALVFIHAADGKVIEVTDDDPPPATDEEHSAIVPDRSRDG